MFCHALKQVVGKILVQYNCSF